MFTRILGVFSCIVIFQVNFVHCIAFFSFFAKDYCFEIVGVSIGLIFF